MKTKLFTKLYHKLLVWKLDKIGLKSKELNELIDIERKLWTF